MNIASIGMLVILAALFYLLALRPARARQAAQQKLVNAIKPGDRVMTTAGMFGTVRALDGDEVELEIADGVTVRMLKPAIARLAPLKDETLAPDSPAADADKAISLDPQTSEVIDVTRPN